MACSRVLPLLRLAPAGSLRSATHSYRSAAIPRFARGLAASSQDLRKTGLYDFHVENGGRMVPFAGYAMPLQYGSVGGGESHHHVRNEVGLFDVGHMVQTMFRGPSATQFLEWLTPSSLSTLAPYSSTLSLLLNERGGIIDDLVVTKHAQDAFFVVTNAGRRDRDLPWIQSKLEEWNSSERANEAGGCVEMEVLDGWGLLALQGPKAAEYLQALTSFDLKSLTFGRSAYVPLEGFNLHVARGGYTGEDGFEISIPPRDTAAVARLLSHPPVALTGLGARDSLRLEAGMCLYGLDLDEDTTPVEAGLTWVIPKARREPGKDGYIGAEAVQHHLVDGPPRRRVGFVTEVPARNGAKIFKPEGGEEVGTVTSGIPSPTLGKNIAMGYVTSGHHKKGTKLEVEVRGKRRAAQVVGMPFVPTRYWKGVSS